MWTCVLISLDSIPRGGIAESYGDFVLNLLKNCQTFPKWLYYFKFTRNIGFQFMHIFTNSVFASFWFGFALLWQLMKDVELVLFVHISSLEKWLLEPVNFLTGLLVFLLLSCETSLYIWIQVPYRCVICKYFLSFYHFHFTFCVWFYCSLQKSLSFWWGLIFLLFVLVVSYLRTPDLIQGHKD